MCGLESEINDKVPIHFLFLGDGKPIACPVTQTCGLNPLDQQFSAIFLWYRFFAH